MRGVSRLFEQGGSRRSCLATRSAIRAGIETDLALQAEPIVSMTVWPPLEKAISSMLLATALSLAATCFRAGLSGELATKIDQRQHPGLRDGWGIRDCL